MTWPVHLQVRQDALDEVAKHADVSQARQMLRMSWEVRTVPRTETIATRKLESGDVAKLRDLYADGESAGESPDFFFDSMVTDGVFYGVFEADDLVAAAGTHLVSRDEGAAAIGNVYTRRARRGRGYSRAATSAVLQALKDLPTVGLNVRADNTSAVRVY